MNEDFLKNFAEKLDAAVKNSQIGNAVIAERAGITHQTLNNYRNGTKTPTIETVYKLAEILDIPFCELLGVSNKKEIALQQEVDDLKVKLSALQQDIADLRAQLRFASQIITGRSERSRMEDDTDDRRLSSGST